MTEEKPFKPTKRKLNKARNEGNVLKSQLLSMSVGLVFCLLTLYLLAQLNLFKNEMLLEYPFDSEGLAAIRYFKDKAWLFCCITSLSLLSAAFGSFISSALITGLSFKWEVLAPKATKLNPAQGLKKIFSNFSFIWQWGLRLFIFAGAILYLTKKYLSSLVVAVESGNLNTSIYIWSELGVSGLALTLGCLLTIGFVEYGVNRKKFFKQMSMSHYELKREHRENDGDPYMKSIRKSLHQEILSHDLVRRIKRSKVVIVEKS
ncbi:MAG: EscU/YscU/HrcU family type III secretion system export apparatus switch protein [Bdellovibrionota bacterium]